MDFFYNENFILTNSAPREIDPLESHKAGYDVFLKLPNSTTITPPVLGDYEAAIFDVNAESWTITPDYRGNKAYSIEDKSEIDIEDIGALPENYVLEAPTSEFDEWNGSSWAYNPDLEALSNAKKFVSTELNLSDIEINLHQDGDSRAIATEQAWRDYRKALRDYVKDEVVVGSEPVRPV